MWFNIEVGGKGWTASQVRRLLFISQSRAQPGAISTCEINSVYCLENTFLDMNPALNKSASLALYLAALADFADWADLADLPELADLAD